MQEIIMYGVINVALIITRLRMRYPEFYTMNVFSDPQQIGIANMGILLSLPKINKFKISQHKIQNESKDSSF